MKKKPTAKTYFIEAHGNRRETVLLLLNTLRSFCHISQENQWLIFLLLV